MPEQRRERHVRWAPQVSSISSTDDIYTPPTPPFGTPVLLPSVDGDSSQGNSPATPPLALPALAHPIDAPEHSSPANPSSSSRTMEGHPVPCEHHSPPNSGRGQGTRRMSVVALSSPLSPHGQAQRRLSIGSPTRSHSHRTANEAPKLHPLLAGTFELKLCWNALDRPTNESVYLQCPDNSIRATTAAILHAAATDPPQKVMHILCGIPDVMAPLTISTGERAMHLSDNTSTGSSGHDSPRSSSSRSSLDAPDYITIQDVIEEMYAYFRHRMSGNDFLSLEKTGIPRLKDRVAIAFHQRCAADESQSPRTASIQNPSASVSRTSASTAPSTPSARSGGLRRIDCLVGRSQFDRLESVPDKGEWVARFGPSGL